MPALDAIEAALRRRLGPLVKRDGAFDLETHLFDQLGLTSIDLVVLMTGLCEELGLSLFALTEADLARIERPRDLVQLFARLEPAAAERSGG